MATTTSTEPKKIWLKDYQTPHFEAQDLELHFDLHLQKTRVRSAFHVKRAASAPAQAPLVLDGETLSLESVSINGRALSANEYQITETALTIPSVPHDFKIEIVVINNPEANSALSGLYLSGGAFTTQCEALGFRRITYFFDRPDVMTNYTVTIEADEKLYPVLLSNGDRVASKKIGSGRHQVTWRDPHKKPCYLFALVAGDLGVIKDQFVTASNRKVTLEIYAPHGQQSRCHHAMESLKKSMKWDETRFGREYDLDTFMIVAMDDFNAGAMENKGLNIFNSRLVLADSKSATDADYYNIESVVAHEYFHNWTGNRVTLRDWFHLSLKEGLTVFRDQEFSMDQSSRASVRIDNVNDLRSAQFSEDAGPNAHPIRPESCYAVDNFYTSTIYEKGSEIIRMMQTMVGRPGFRKGMDLYFKRHDGQAVIIEDFAQCISEANSQDWEQFKLWYSQAGTPHVSVKENYRTAEQTYELTLTQTCAPSPGQPEKKPFHIPLTIGLLNSKGEDIPLHCPEITKNTEGESLLHLKKAQQTFVFKNVVERPLLSLNRGFSAPIELESEASEKDLNFLMSHDADAFNRWEAGQKLSVSAFSQMIGEVRTGKAPTLPESLVVAYGNVLADTRLDSEFKAQMLSLPDDSYLIQHEPVLEAQAFLKAREFLESAIGTKHESLLLKIYEQFHGKNLESKDPKVFGDRRLKNLSLAYLASSDRHHSMVYEQFKNAKIMTDQMAALGILSHVKSDYSIRALQEFYQQWQDDALVLNKWFAVQAVSTHPDTFERVVKLCDHPAFNIKNPNRVYSLLWRFGENLVRFHDSGKDTYTFYADKLIEVDKLNPNVAARLAGSFDIWVKLPESQKQRVANQLDRLLSSGLSSNTYEIISKCKDAAQE